MTEEAFRVFFNKSLEESKVFVPFMRLVRCILLQSACCITYLFITRVLVNDPGFVEYEKGVPLVPIFLFMFVFLEMVMYFRKVKQQPAAKPAWLETLLIAAILHASAYVAVRAVGYSIQSMVYLAMFCLLMAFIGFHLWTGMIERKAEVRK